VLALYEQPYGAKEPVVCLDEKPVSLHAEVRPARPRRISKWRWNPRRLRRGRMAQGTVAGFGARPADLAPFGGSLECPAGCCELTASTRARIEPGHGVITGESDVFGTRSPGSFSGLHETDLG
jgi:hypothetical protein